MNKFKNSYIWALFHPIQMIGLVIVAWKEASKARKQYLEAKRKAKL